MINMSLKGKAIYNYGIYKDCIDLKVSGGVITIKNKDEISVLKQWIKEGKQFAKNKAEICTCLEYMIDYGQFDD